MPLFLKALDPTIDILGNEQVLRYNTDQINNDANLLLLNDFTAIAGVFPSTSLVFASTTLKGFQFKHELKSSSVYGDFNLKTYDKFGSSTDIFKYDELTDSLIFFKNVGLPTIVSNASIYSLTINNTNSSATATGLLVQNNGINGCAFGFNNSTNEAYVWAYGTASLKFGTNNTKQAQILNNGTFDLITNNLTTTGTINAQTGTLKGNNLAVHNSGSISVLNSLNMNSNYINFLPTPLNNQDAATKQFVLDNSGGSTQSILHGYVYSSYSSNLSTGDHIKFDNIAFVRGSNISLDTSSSYTTSTGVASIGRITLAAGKTYKLTAITCTAAFTSTSNAYIGLKWYNSDSNTPLGTVNTWWSSSWSYTSGGAVVAYITTTSTTRVELRINNISSISQIWGTSDSNSATWFSAEEV